MWPTLWRTTRSSARPGANKGERANPSTRPGGTAATGSGTRTGCSVSPPPARLNRAHLQQPCCRCARGPPPSPGAAQRCRRQRAHPYAAHRLHEWSAPGEGRARAGSGPRTRSAGCRRPERSRSRSRLNMGTPLLEGRLTAWLEDVRRIADRLFGARGWLVVAVQRRCGSSPPGDGLGEVARIRGRPGQGR